jgi:hypothetical protein
LREPDDLRSWPARRYWHACCVDNRQAFFLWIGAGCAPHRMRASRMETAGFLARPAACSRSSPPGWSRRSHFRSCRLVWATVALGNFLLGCLGFAPSTTAQRH